MANWDVFHGDRLELERGLTTSAIRDGLARGDLRDDDLVRPAGTTVAWARLADMPQLLEPPETPVQPELRAQPPVASHSPPVNLPTSAARPSESRRQAEEIVAKSSTKAGPKPSLGAPDWFQLREDSDDVSFPVITDEPARPGQPPAGSQAAEVAPAPAWEWDLDDDSENLEEDDADFEGRAAILEDQGADQPEIIDDDADDGADVPFALVDDPVKDDTSSHLALPVVTSNEWDAVGAAAGAGALAEVPEEEDFSLSRSGPMTVEELDLAPMVDVAFQLVLFFMVAAQTVLYKTLEIPKPSTEQAPAAVAQGRSRSLEELKEDYILVEIDGSGAMKIDREPVAADANALVERLRRAREATHRKAMLLSAEYATAHRNTVLAYDAANEIGLGIVIARPASPQGPAPGLLPAQPAAQAPAAAQPVVPN